MNRQRTECGEASLAAAREEIEGGHMVACDLEAAEVLARLARSSSSPGGALASRESEPTEAVVVASASQSQDQPVDGEQVCDNTTMTISSHEKTQKTAENIPNQLCSTSYQSNPVIKSRRKLTEVEKEERKLRRILANRESARKTIWRRQAMHLELTRKAADVLEENENLKKEKRLAVEEHNSLKDRNEYLKAQLAKINKAESGEMEEEPKMSEAEKSCSAPTKSTPIATHNQPSVVPCFWPSIIPSLDVCPFHCAHSHNTSSSLFSMPQQDIPCSHQGQEHSVGNTKLGTPLIVVPVPWLLPLFAHSSTLHSHSGTNDDRTNTHQCSKCSCSETLAHGDNNQLSSDQNNMNSNPMKNMSADNVHRTGLTLPPDSGDAQSDSRHPSGTIIVPSLFSPVKPLETRGPPRSCQVDDIIDVNADAAAAPESVIHGLSQRDQEPIIWPRTKPEDVFAATVARRRRKELMKLKNVHCRYVRTRY